MTDVCTCLDVFGEDPNCKLHGGPLRLAVFETFGARCDQFDPECETCRAWAEIDRIEALTAALPHMGGVRVKPLEWEPVHGEGVETYQATCATGIYRVFEDEDSAAGAVFAEFAIDVSRFCMTDALSIGRFHNFDVAQAAAQADYERRVISALALSEAPEGEKTRPPPPRGAARPS